MSLFILSTNLKLIHQTNLVFKKFFIVPFSPSCNWTWANMSSSDKIFAASELVAQTVFGFGQFGSSYSFLVLNFWQSPRNPVRSCPLTLVHSRISLIPKFRNCCSDSQGFRRYQAAAVGKLIRKQFQVVKSLKVRLCARHCSRSFFFSSTAWLAPFQLPSFLGTIQRELFFIRNFLIRKILLSNIRELRRNLTQIVFLNNIQSTTLFSLVSTFVCSLFYSGI